MDPILNQINPVDIVFLSILILSSHLHLFLRSGPFVCIYFCIVVILSAGSLGEGRDIHEINLTKMSKMSNSVTEICM
jgi:hypothetical protein